MGEARGTKGSAGVRLSSGKERGEEQEALQWLSDEAKRRNAADNQQRVEGMGIAKRLLEEGRKRRAEMVFWQGAQGKDLLGRDERGASGRWDSGDVDRWTISRGGGRVWAGGLPACLQQPQAGFEWMGAL